MGGNGHGHDYRRKPNNKSSAWNKSVASAGSAGGESCLMSIALMPIMFPFVIYKVVKYNRSK